MVFLRSKRFWISILIFIGIMSLKINPLLITGLIFMIASIYNKKTIRPLKNYKFWIIILVLVIIVPIFTGNQDKSFIGVQYSSEQLLKTLLMTLRGISVFLIFQVLTIDLNIDSIKPVFSKIGIKNFDVLYSLSNEIFPKIKSILNARFNLFKINWKKKKSFELLLVFLTDIFTDFFHLSDSLITSESESIKISPNDFLNNYDLSQKPAIYIIVGDAGIGKTPWIEKLINLIQNIGQTVDGLISKKHVISEDNWQHELIRISTDEKRQLTTMDEIDTTTRVGKFHFYDDVIDWGNIQLNSISNTDFFIIDEIGLLEFDGNGFLSGLKHISTNYKGNLVITIRSSMQKYFDEFIEKELPDMTGWNKCYISI